MQIQSPKNRKGNTIPTLLNVRYVVASTGILLVLMVTTALLIVTHTIEDALLQIKGPVNNPQKMIRSSFRKAISNPHNPASTFDWMDVEASKQIKGNCGADKCFWRSVSDPENVGYLIASAKYHFGPMKQAYEFAVNILENRCQAKHLYLEAPVRVPVSPDLLDQLESLKNNPHFQFVDKLNPNRPSRAARLVFDHEDSFLVIQKVKVAPQPNLSFGYMARKWDKLVNIDLPAFRRLLDEKGIAVKSMEANLDSERRGIECAMQHSDTYYYDMQGFIDLEGNYIHMDVDSQFWVRLEEETDINDDDSGLIFVKKADAYKYRIELMSRFNEMVLRLVNPPPMGVEELPAWDDDEN